MMVGRIALGKPLAVLALIALLHGCGGGEDSSAAAGPGMMPSVPAMPLPAPAAAATSVVAPSVASQSVPLRIDAISPASGPPATVVTLHGSGFTRDTRVLWGDQSLQAVYQSNTAITFTLPATHTGADVSRPVTAVREDGASAMAPVVQTVEGIPEAASLDRNRARIGEVLRIRGTALNLVTRIALTGTEATRRAVASDGSWLDFIVPDGAGSGSVAMQDMRGRVYEAGDLKVEGPPLTLAIDDVEIAQSHMQSVSAARPNPYLRLVPLKPLLVRVRLSPANGVDTIEPDVRLQASNDKLGTQWFTMQGPTRLGTARIAEGDLAGSYTYELPGEWVQSGFRLLVEANERRFPIHVARYAYVPAAGVLGQPTYIRLHIVPIQPDSGQVVSFDVEALKRNVRDQYPLSKVDFVVERALKQPGTTLANSNAWLDAITALRAGSAPSNHDFYLGVLPCGACTGLGYTPGRTAVVSQSWIIQGVDQAVNGVMLHELGHNFGRLHTWDDPAFPYWENGIASAGGKARLGGAWAINLLGGRQLHDPAIEYDIMSYDYPKSVSDYTYRGAYDYIEKNLPLNAGVTVAAESFPSTNGQVLYLSGTLDRAGISARISPVMRMLAQPDTVALAESAGRTDFEVEVRTATGMHRYPVHVVPLSHAEDAMASVFNLTIPLVDDIRSIRVLRGGQALVTRVVDGDGRPPLRAPSVQQPLQWGSYYIGDGVLSLRWNAQRWPWISVWQRVDGRLSPLAITRNGGVLSERVDARVTGLVISLSDGLNGELIQIDTSKR